MTGIKQAERLLLSAIAEGHIPHACFISCADFDMAEILARKAAAAAKAAAHAAAIVVLTGDDAGGYELIGNVGLVCGKVQGGLALPFIPYRLVLFAVLALDGAPGD